MMRLLSDTQYQHLQSALQSPRTYRPIVGDFLVLVNPDYIYTESGLYQDNPTRSRNTVLKLYRVTKISRNSIYTVSDIVNHTEYLRWQPFEGCWSSVYPRWTQMLAAGTIPKTTIDMFFPYEAELPLIEYRHRNTLQCIQCDKMIDVYRHHPKPETLVQEYEFPYCCEACETRLSVNNQDLQ